MIGRYTIPSDGSIIEITALKDKYQWRYVESQTKQGMAFTLSGDELKKVIKKGTITKI